MTTHLGSTGLGMYLDSNNIQYIMDQQVVIDIDKADKTLQLSNLTLTGIPTPVNSSDAANKSYVDNTPFIQLYATSIPAVNAPLTTHWTSIQSNVLQFTTDHIHLSAQIYKITVNLISDDNALVLGICKGSVSTYLSSYSQYRTILADTRLEFIHQAATGDYFNLYVVSRSGDNHTTKVQLIVQKI